MLVFVPEPSAPHHECDVAERADRDQGANAGKEAECKQYSSDQFGSFSSVNQVFDRRRFEYVPIEISLHYLRPENLMTMVNEQQSDNDPEEANSSIGRMLRGCKQFHFRNDFVIVEFQQFFASPLTVRLFPAEQPDGYGVGYRHPCAHPQEITRKLPQ